MITNGNTIDPRVRRTKKRLRDALLELIAEKEYRKLTIQEIIDRADVNRTTFYRQFQDKDDLLQVVITDLVEEMLSEIERTDLIIKHKPPYIPANQLAKFFEHAQAYQDVLKALNTEGGTFVFRHKFISTLEKILYERIKLSNHDVEKLPIPLSLTVTYLINGYIAALQWWLNHSEEYSAEFVSKKTIDLMLDGVSAAVGMNETQDTREVDILKD